MQFRGCSSRTVLRSGRPCARVHHERHDRCRCRRRRVCGVICRRFCRLLRAKTASSAYVVRVRTTRSRNEGRAARGATKARAFSGADGARSTFETRASSIMPTPSMGAGGSPRRRRRRSRKARSPTRARAPRRSRPLRRETTANRACARGRRRALFVDALVASGHARRDARLPPRGHAHRERHVGTRDVVSRRLRSARALRAERLERRAERLRVVSFASSRLERCAGTEFGANDVRR